MTLVANQSDEERESIDLLPRISHETLTTRDMASWFSGLQETIEDKTSTVANVVDGDGCTRDGGTAGRRGYRGDYRFTVIGASTPLEPRAWRVVGHTGYRFVFDNLSADEIGRDQLEDELFSDSRYPERVERCREAVHGFLKSLWDEYGGYSGVEEHFDATDEAREAIAYLGQLVKFSRATLGEDDEPGRENPSASEQSSCRDVGLHMKAERTRGYTPKEARYGAVTKARRQPGRPNGVESHGECREDGRLGPDDGGRPRRLRGDGISGLRVVQVLHQGEQRERHLRRPVGPDATRGRELPPAEGPHPKVQAGPLLLSRWFTRATPERSRLRRTARTVPERRTRSGEVIEGCFRLARPPQ